MNFPDNIRENDYVMACIHVIDNPVAGDAQWGPSGRAVSDQDGKVSIVRYDFSVVCDACKLEPSDVVLRRTRFYGGKLNLGWWSFESASPRK